MVSTDEMWMREAIQEAKKAANQGDWPMGCVIVVDGKIVAREHNTGYSEQVRLAHAELKALLNAREILEQHKGEAVLYTTHEPCPMCFGAIVMMKIGRVVTGIDIDESGSLNLQDHLPNFFQKEKFRFEITRGVLAKECLEVYQSSEIGRKHLQKLDE